MILFIIRSLVDGKYQRAIKAGLMATFDVAGRKPRAPIHLVAGSGQLTAWLKWQMFLEIMGRSAGAYSMEPTTVDGRS